MLKIGSFLFEQQTPHTPSILLGIILEQAGTNRKGKANVFTLSGWGYVTAMLPSWIGLS